ncbi:MAG: hypothetical protein WCH60_08055 [Burkholderiales bacterium]
MDEARRQLIEEAKERYFQQVCAHWGKFSTLEVWEAAALMNNVSPTALQDIVVNDEGDGLDLSDESRMLISAIEVGELLAHPPNLSPPSDHTNVVVASLIHWLHRRGYVTLADALKLAQDGASASAFVSSQASPIEGALNLTIPLQRMVAQEFAILEKLTELHYKPLALPKNKPGKSGVKAEVKKALGSTGIWEYVTVFDKAWERLLGDGRIVTTM